LHIINNDENKVNLLGKKIIHKDFGEGIISDIDTHLTLIEFSDYGMVALKLPVTRMKFK
jgi:cyanate lyase